MKSVKYKFFSDRTAGCVARHYLLEMYFLGNFFSGFSYNQRNLRHSFTLQLQTVLLEKWNFVQLLFIQESLAYLLYFTQI